MPSILRFRFTPDEAPRGVGAVGPTSRIEDLVAREFPTVELVTTSSSTDVVPAASSVTVVDIEAWHSPRFDLYAFDALVDRSAEAGPFVVGVAARTAIEAWRGTLEVLTRSQRVVRRRNTASRAAWFDEVLARHRALHDLTKPLVLADYRHALDTWQWLLRLEPGASGALQTAALFHDIERLATEADRRIEHLAPNYQAFKDRHARSGSRITASVLAHTAMSGSDRRKACELVARHERTDDDSCIALLNDADALSFFSLNSSGFIDYYGPDHTKRKIAYTLARMRPEARRHVEHVHLRADIAPLARAVLDTIQASDSRPRRQ